MRRHLLCRRMGWTPQQVDEMPWRDVLWTEHLIALEAKIEAARAEPQELI